MGQTQFTSSTGSKRVKREQCLLDGLENTDSAARVWASTAERDREQNEKVEHAKTKITDQVDMGIYWEQWLAK